MSRFGRSDGFALAAVMLALLAATAITLGAYAAAKGDIHLAEEDVDHKRALAAAEAGLADYLQKLGSDNEYWLKCTDVPPLADGSPAPVNQQWDGNGADPRVWRTMPSEPSAAYTIELLPLAPYERCERGVDASMLDSSGMLRLRVTGRAGVPGREVERALVTTLRRNGFLDFLYFTEYETSDPTQLELETQGVPTKRCAPAVNCATEPIAGWGAAACSRYLRDGRDSVYYPGSFHWNPPGSAPLGWYEYPPGSNSTSDRLRCSRIYFISGDAVRGPFHTNDTMSICGSPTFGRNRGGATSAPIDRVEFWAFDSFCGGGPDFGNNRVITGPDMPILQLPQSNAELEREVLPGYRFSGRTTIELQGGSMRVNGASMALPPNGLIYVANGGTCPQFSPLQPEQAAPGCGDALVSGSYGENLTIAAQRDVILTGSVTRNGNTLLGLIANNFVRVAHPMRSYPCNRTTQNVQNAPQDRRIEAAILSLGHVFTVDSYHCGRAMGTLSVYGAIAQKYRGPVGTFSGGTPVTGYYKDYEYDDRLRFRSPPHFLAPIQSAWRVVRSTEQTGAP